jgi:hypothetical protein
MKIYIRRCNYFIEPGFRNNHKRSEPDHNFTNAELCLSQEGALEKSYNVVMIDTISKRTSPKIFKNLFIIKIIEQSKLTFKGYKHCLSLLN